MTRQRTARRLATLLRFERIGSCAFLLLGLTLLLGRDTPPSLSSALITQAETAFSLGQSARAIDLYQAALRANPQDATAARRLAETQLDLRRWPDALTSLRSWSSLVPGQAWPHYLLGLLALGREQTAAGDLAQAAVDPTLAPGVARLRASLPIMTGRAAGLALVDQALWAETTRLGCPQRCLALLTWSLAIDRLSEAIATQPDDPLALAWLGLARDHSGGNGIAELQRAVSLAPDQPLPHALLGYHWRATGHTAEALNELTAAARLDAGNGALSVELGQAYAAMGDLLSAEAWLTQATRQEPRAAMTWKALAAFYLDRAVAVKELGLPAAQHTVDLAPDDPEALDLLGWAQALSGQTDQALDTLGRALRLDPNLPAAHYHLGRLYRLLGEATSGEAELHEAIRLDPDGPYGKSAARALGGDRQAMSQ